MLLFLGWAAILPALALAQGTNDIGRKAPLALAENYRIDNWSTEEGLSENSVNAITQTADGFLWVATRDGLARFDGVHFSIFNRGITPGLTQRRFSRLLPAKDGALWILSDNGALFRWYEGKFREYTGNDGLPDRGCSAMSEDNTGALWVTASSGGECYRLEGDRFKIVADVSHFTKGNVWQLQRDSAGVLWGLATGDLIRLHPGTPEKIPKPSTAGNPPLLLGMLADPRGGLWIGTDVGPVQYSSGKWEPVISSDPERGISSFGSIVFLKDGTVWATMDSTENQGLILFEPDGKARRVTVRGQVGSEHVTTLFVDSEENIWFGMQGMGLFRAKRKSFHGITMADGLAGRTVRSVTADNQGVVWAVTPAGVNRIEAGPILRISIPKYPVPLLWNAMADKSGKVWIGSFGLGLYQAFPDHLEEFRPGGQRLGHVATVLFQDSTGAIWKGSDHDLLKLSPAGAVSFQAPPGMTNLDVRAMAEDQNGVLYVGLRDAGLLRYEKGRVTRITSHEGLGDDYIGALLVDSENTLWVGTMGKGLTRVRDGICRNLTNSNGILPTTINAILEDDQGMIWLGSHTGVYRASRSELNRVADNKAGELNLRRFGKTDGMSSSECFGGVQPSAWKTSDGRLWFGTSDGLSVVDPHSLQFNTKPPAVYIDRVRVNGETDLELDRDPSGGMRRANASPGVFRLEIHYTALCFTAPEKMRFRYRLEGADSAWVDAQDQRVAFYTQLAPGTYRFQVAACNNDGVWNEKGDSLEVVIRPFYWQTTTFKLLLAILSAGCVVGIQEYRIRKLRELQRLRGQIAMDLHDEIGSNLGSMALLADRAVKKNAPDQSSEWSKVSGIAQQTSQAMREIVWFTNPDFDTLPELVARMKDTAAQFLQATSWTFDAPNPVPNLKLSLAQRKSIFLIYKEALHNAAQHSGALKVRIQLRVEKGSLHLTVEDDGKGMPDGKAAADPSSLRGNGCRNMRKRAIAIGGKISWTTDTGRGVQMKFEAPLK